MLALPKIQKYIFGMILPVSITTAYSKCIKLDAIRKRAKTDNHKTTLTVRFQRRKTWLQ